MNMPIQGTEADLMKMAMIQVQEKLEHVFSDTKEVDAPKQLLQIHDSIIIECKDTDAAKVEEILVDTMENIYPSLGVKLKVDVKSGVTWGDL